MSCMFFEEIFKSKGYKKIIENFRNKLRNNGDSTRNFYCHVLNTHKIHYFIDTLINLGVNRTKESLENEINEIGCKFNDLTDYGCLILMGPKFYNIILEKITNRGNYSSLGALQLDIIYEIIVPLYNFIKNFSKLNNKEIFSFIYAIFLEKPVDLQVFPYFLEIENSSGFFEAFSILNLSPIKDKLDKKEKDFQNKSDNTNLLNIIKTKYQINDINLKKVTDTMLPVQQIFSPIGSIERIITSIKIRKNPIDKFQEDQIENAILKVVRGIYELHAKQLVGLNKDASDFITDISEHFSQLIEKQKEELINTLKIQTKNKSDIIQITTDCLKKEILDYVDRFYFS
ncbi:MAG: hypothetical protein ACTSX4_01845 [Candidatus Helarchaeota archaeon]